MFRPSLSASNFIAAILLAMLAIASSPRLFAADDKEADESWQVIHLAGQRIGYGRVVIRKVTRDRETVDLTDTDAAYGLPLFQACCDAVALPALHGAEVHDPTRPEERAVVLANQPEVSVESLPESLLEKHGVHRQRLPVDFQPAAGASLPEIVEEFERRLITDQLEKCGANQTETAKRLRVARSRFKAALGRLRERGEA